MNQLDANSIKSRRRVVFSERQAFFPMDFSFLFKTQTRQFQCAYCGAFIPDKLLSRDHVYPKSKGGNSTTACCLDCNEIKKNMLPIQWAIHASQNGYDISTSFYKGAGKRENNIARTARKVVAKEISAIPP